MFWPDQPDWSCESKLKESRLDRCETQRTTRRLPLPLSSWKTSLLVNQCPTPITALVSVTTPWIDLLCKYAEYGVVRTVFLASNDSKVRQSHVIRWPYTLVIWQSEKTLIHPFGSACMISSPFTYGKLRNYQIWRFLFRFALTLQMCAVTHKGWFSTGRIILL